jgi:hypothetical protein
MMSMSGVSRVAIRSTGAALAKLRLGATGASFNQHFGQVANITFHQAADFPPQYGDFFASAERLLIVQRRCSSARVADVELASAGASR